MGMEVARKNEVLTWLHGGAAPAALTTPIRCRLMTANGSDSAAGTELANGGGYTGGASAPSTAWAAASAGSQATNAAVSITNMPAATIVGIELWDSTGTPKRCEWGSHTSKTTAAGDTLTYASGAITSSIS